MAYDTIVIENNPVNVLESYHQELNQDEFDIQNVISRDMGGFWSAKFGILNPRRNYALQMLSNGPGRSVKFFNDRSICVWEGFISKVVVSTGAASAFNDIQPVANEVWVRYRDFTTGNLARSTVAAHENSSLKYGQKDWVLSGGQLRDTVADQKAENYLDLNYWATPQLDSFEIGGRGAGEVDLQVQCLGWWHTLDWRVYNQTILVVEANAGAVVTAITTAVGDFIESTQIEANATQVAQEYDADRRAGGIIKSIADLGDARGNAWIAGVGLDREFYFKVGAPPTEV